LLLLLLLLLPRRLRRPAPRLLLAGAALVGWMEMSVFGCVFLVFPFGCDLTQQLLLVVCLTCTTLPADFQASATTAAAAEVSSDLWSREDKLRGGGPLACA
jgi:hypothetical protein